MTMPSTFYHRFGKRSIDLTAALLLSCALLPLLLAIAVLVRLKLGSPILFRQQRPGKDAKPFWMYKFRTMTDQRDEAGELLPDEVRLTRFGKFLRGTSLDELPELWNVIRGEMSLIGPRPLLMQYVPLYSTEQFRRHEALPGITGWAQVNGRNSLTWEEKFAHDVWYVDHVSLWLDLKILWLTAIRVVRRDGISAAGCATMPVFKRGTSSTEQGANNERRSRAA